MTPEQELLLKDWFRRVRESQRVHYACETHFNRLHLLLGVPTIVLSAFVGTAVFATLAEVAAGWKQVSVGMLSVAAAVLASLQTFMAYGTRAARHHATGSHYGAIRRDLELFKTFPRSDAAALEARFAGIKKQMDDLAENAPFVPVRIKKRIDRELKSHEHRRVFTLEAKH